MTTDLNKLANSAQAGDRKALENLVRAVQDRVYHLAMRMLVDPDDARDATQEILILAITKLSTFRGDSAFSTWVYRVAANYLLNARKKAARERQLTFDDFAADLEDGLVADPPRAPDDAVMLNELRISCTMAMLLCLDIEQRLAYVLGDILELDHAEASSVLGINAAAYRQRLSRARRQVVAFTSRHCGLASDEAKCRCPRRLPAAKASGRIGSAPAFATAGAPGYADVLDRVRSVEGDLKVLKLQTATAPFRFPDDLGHRIADIVQDIR